MQLTLWLGELTKLHFMKEFLCSALLAEYVVFIGGGYVGNYKHSLLELSCCTLYFAKCAEVE